MLEKRDEVQVGLNRIRKDNSAGEGNPPSRPKCYEGFVRNMKTFSRYERLNNNFVPS